MKIFLRPLHSISYEYIFVCNKLIYFYSSASSKESFHFPVFILNSPPFPKLSGFFSGWTLCTRARTGIFCRVDAEDTELLKDLESSEAIDAPLSKVLFFGITESSVGAFIYCPFVLLGEDRQTGKIRVTQNITAPRGTRAVPTKVKSSNKLLNLMAFWSTSVLDPSLFFQVNNGSARYQITHKHKSHSN